MFQEVECVSSCGTFWRKQGSGVEAWWERSAAAAASIAMAALGLPSSCPITNHISTSPPPALRVLQWNVLADGLAQTGHFSRVSPSFPHFPLHLGFISFPAAIAYLSWIGQDLLNSNKSFPNTSSDCGDEGRQAVPGVELSCPSLAPPHSPTPAPRYLLARAQPFWYDRVSALLWWCSCLWSGDCERFLLGDW